MCWLSDVTAHFWAIENKILGQEIIAEYLKLFFKTVESFPSMGDVGEAGRIRTPNPAKDRDLANKS